MISASIAVPVIENFLPGDRFGCLNLIDYPPSLRLRWTGSDFEIGNY